MTGLAQFVSFVQSHRQEMLTQTYQHIWITSIALLIAIIIGVTIGMLLTRYQQFSRPALGFVNVIQTIPSVALLGFLLPFFGIGVTPAIIALFLYALLPIVRNTYTGIAGVDKAIVEAAKGLGMSGRQILRKVELPLAMPIIFAGIRTAMVINIGVATLCALIAAGGLGEYIFRGIAVNNVNMILAGAVPASLLAIILDAILSIIQKHIQKIGKYVLIGVGAACLLLIGYQLSTLFFSAKDTQLFAGFNSEFMEREDGYRGLTKAYDFTIETREMDIGLMYAALHNKKVDVISGFSTDGRIRAYNLRVLEDDKHYFPPYFAAPLVRQKTLDRFPAISDALGMLDGKISEDQMMQMNYAVDQKKEGSREVARAFLKQAGFKVVPKKEGAADIIIGSKNFSENLILAEIFAAVIEANTTLTTGMKLGFGGTKLLMDAIKTGGIDVYPEYTGTGLLVLLQPEKPVIDSLIADKQKVYDYVKKLSKEQYGLVWLRPLGFNNTTALMMRNAEAEELKIVTITDLSTYINTHQDK